MQTIAGAGYDVDFVLWAESQATALREGRFDDVDIENVSDEIESLARSDKRELRTRLATLMLHLLKLEYQPSMATKSWQHTVVEQAALINELLEESRSSRPELDGAIRKAYSSVRRQAAAQTDLPLDTFPAELPPGILAGIIRAMKEGSLP